MFSQPASGSSFKAPEEIAAFKWKRIYERAGASKMRISCNMQTAGWVRAIEARVKSRWGRIARDTQMHLIEYQLAHQYNLGIDVGRWLNLGIITP